MVEVDNGKHIPENPDKFEFDAEVAEVFDNMAERSLPNYLSSYRVIGHLAARMKLPKYSQVWDIGTSTGRGLSAIKDGVGLNPYLDYYGVDISEPMCKKAAENCPFATIVNHDLNLGLPSQVKQGKVSVFVFGWVLQFIEDTHMRRVLLQEAYKSLAAGGFIVVMEKYRLPHEIMNGVMQDSYISMRVDNGYSLEEVEKKTAALRNSMWPSTPDFTTEILKECGADVQVLYRELNFGGVVAFKPEA